MLDGCRTQVDCTFQMEVSEKLSSGAVPWVCVPLVEGHHCGQMKWVGPGAAWDEVVDFYEAVCGCGYLSLPIPFSRPKGFGSPL